jgi:hypothetical protein
MKTFLLTGVFILIFASCNDDEPVPFDQVLNEPEESTGPPNNGSLLTGTFTSFAHGLSGSVSQYTLDNQQRIIQLEDFTMSSGPDVFVFLSKTNNYSESNTIGVAKLTKSYDRVRLSIPLDPAINLQTHPFVLVYCVQFSSLFGFAELK